MSKTRVTMQSLLVMSVFSSVLVSSASAATHIFKIEGTEITKATEFQGQQTQEPPIIQIGPPTPLPSGRVPVEGETLRINGMIHVWVCTTTTTTVTITGSNITVTQTVRSCNWKLPNTKGQPTPDPNCKFAGEKMTLEAKGELDGRGEILDTGSKAEETLSEFTVEGEKCEIAGTYKLKGKEVCTIPETEFEKVIHGFICTPAGSKVTLESKSVKIEGPGVALWITEEVEPVSLKNWSST